MFWFPQHLCQLKYHYVVQSTNSFVRLFMAMMSSPNKLLKYCAESRIFSGIVCGILICDRSTASWSTDVHKYLFRVLAWLFLEFVPLPVDVLGCGPPVDVWAVAPDHHFHSHSPPHFPKNQCDRARLVGVEYILHLLNQKRLHLKHFLAVGWMEYPSFFSCGIHLVVTVFWKTGCFNFCYVSIFSRLNIYLSSGARE